MACAPCTSAKRSCRGECGSARRPAPLPRILGRQDLIQSRETATTLACSQCKQPPKFAGDPTGKTGGLPRSLLDRGRRIPPYIPPDSRVVPLPYLPGQGAIGGPKPGPASGRPEQRAPAPGEGAEDSGPGGSGGGGGGGGGGVPCVLLCACLSDALPPPPPDGEPEPQPAGTPTPPIRTATPSDVTRDPAQTTPLPPPATPQHAGVAQSHHVAAIGVQEQPEGHIGPINLPDEPEELDPWGDYGDGVTVTTGLDPLLQGAGAVAGPRRGEQTANNALPPMMFAAVANLAPVQAAGLGKAPGIQPLGMGGVGGQLGGGPAREKRAGGQQAAQAQANQPFGGGPAGGLSAQAERARVRGSGSGLIPTIQQEYISRAPKLQRLRSKVVGGTQIPGSQPTDAREVGEVSADGDGAEELPIAAADDLRDGRQPAPGTEEALARAPSSGEVGEVGTTVSDALQPTDETHARRTRTPPQLQSERYPLNGQSLLDIRAPLQLNASLQRSAFPRTAGGADLPPRSPAVGAEGVWQAQGKRPGTAPQGSPGGMGLTGVSKRLGRAEKLGVEEIPREGPRIGHSQSPSGFRATPLAAPGLGDPGAAELKAGARSRFNAAPSALGGPGDAEILSQMQQARGRFKAASATPPGAEGVEAQSLMQQGRSRFNAAGAPLPASALASGGLIKQGRSRFNAAPMAPPALADSTVGSQIRQGRERFKAAPMTTPALGAASVGPQVKQGRQRFKAAPGTLGGAGLAAIAPRSQGSAPAVGAPASPPEIGGMGLARLGKKAAQRPPVAPPIAGARGSAEASSLSRLARGKKAPRNSEVSAEGAGPIERPLPGGVSWGKPPFGSTTEIRLKPGKPSRWATAASRPGLARLKSVIGEGADMARRYLRPEPVQDAGGLRRLLPSVAAARDRLVRPNIAATGAAWEGRGLPKAGALRSLESLEKPAREPGSAATAVRAAAQEGTGEVGEVQEATPRRRTAARRVGGGGSSRRYSPPAGVVPGDAARRVLSPSAVASNGTQVGLVSGEAGLGIHAEQDAEDLTITPQAAAESVAGATPVGGSIPPFRKDARITRRGAAGRRAQPLGDGRQTGIPGYALVPSLPRGSQAGGRSRGRGRVGAIAMATGALADARARADRASDEAHAEKRAASYIRDNVKAALSMAVEHAAAARRAQSREEADRRKAQANEMLRIAAREAARAKECDTRAAAAQEKKAAAERDAEVAAARCRYLGHDPDSAQGKAAVKSARKQIERERKRQTDRRNRREAKIRGRAILRPWQNEDSRGALSLFAFGAMDDARRQRDMATQSRAAATQRASTDGQGYMSSVRQAARDVKGAARDVDRAAKEAVAADRQGSVRAADRAAGNLGVALAESAAAQARLSLKHASNATARKVERDGPEKVAVADPARYAQYGDRKAAEARVNAEESRKQLAEHLRDGGSKDTDKWRLYARDAEKQDAEVALWHARSEAARMRADGEKGNQADLAGQVLVAEAELRKAEVERNQAEAKVRESGERASEADRKRLEQLEKEVEAREEALRARKEALAEHQDKPAKEGGGDKVQREGEKEDEKEGEAKPKRSIVMVDDPDQCKSIQVESDDVCCYEVCTPPEREIPLKWVPMAAGMVCGAPPPYPDSTGGAKGKGPQPGADSPGGEGAVVPTSANADGLEIGPPDSAYDLRDPDSDADGLPEEDDEDQGRSERPEPREDDLEVEIGAPGLRLATNEELSAWIDRDVEMRHPRYEDNIRNYYKANTRFDATGQQTTWYVDDSGNLVPRKEPVNPSEASGLSRKTVKLTWRWGYRWGSLSPRIRVRHEDSASSSGASGVLRKKYLKYRSQRPWGFGYPGTGFQPRRESESEVPWNERVNRAADRLEQWERRQSALQRELTPEEREQKDLDDWTSVFSSIIPRWPRDWQEAVLGVLSTSPTMGGLDLRQVLVPAVSKLLFDDPSAIGFVTGAPFRLVAQAVSQREELIAPLLLTDGDMSRLPYYQYQQHLEFSEGDYSRWADENPLFVHLGESAPYVVIPWLRGRAGRLRVRGGRGGQGPRQSRLLMEPRESPPAGRLPDSERVFIANRRGEVVEVPKIVRAQGATAYSASVVPVQVPVQGGRGGAPRRVTQFFKPLKGGLEPGSPQALASREALAATPGRLRRALEGNWQEATWVSPRSLAEQTWVSRMLTGRGWRRYALEFDVFPGEMIAPRGLKAPFARFQQVIPGRVSLAGRNAVVVKLPPNYAEFAFEGALAAGTAYAGYRIFSAADDQ
jgi:hypothetical protein